MTEIEKIQITDELMQAITQTEHWLSAQEHDPMINQANNRMESLLKRLPQHWKGMISEAMAEVVNSYCDAAILYGIYLAGALQYGAAHSKNVSQYLLDRMERGRKTA